MDLRNIPISNAPDVDIIGRADGEFIQWNSVTEKHEYNPISTGITIGTTPITSGTDGRVLFQSGGVVQQDSTLFWDNTNKRLGVGATPSSSVRLDVRSQGALSTDIGFRVRNSADSTNILEVIGTGGVNINGFQNSQIPLNVNQYSNSFGETATLLRLRETTVNASFAIRNVKTNIYNKWEFVSGGSGDGLNTEHTFMTVIGNNANSVWTGTYFNKNMGIGGLSSNGSYIFSVLNGTTPTMDDADTFKMYSADIVVGNAAPHFRTENGSVIKIYQETTGVAAATLAGGGGTALTDTDTFDGYTLKQIVKALRNQGLLA